MATERSNRDKLKGYFKRNEIPTQENFAELIDGMLNLKDDGITKLPGGPLEVAGMVAISEAGNPLEKKPGVLQIRKDVHAKLGPILSIVNGAGATGAGAAIDFYTYWGAKEDLSGVRIEAKDDGKSSANLIFSAKMPMDKTQTKQELVETLRITSSGAVAISGGASDVVARGCMARGSLSIGSLSDSYGGNKDGWGPKGNEHTNIAALVLETANYTEIAVHEKGGGLRSLLYFTGGKDHQITIGRNMGDGLSQVVVPGILTADSMNVSKTLTVENRHVTTASEQVYIVQGFVESKNEEEKGSKIEGSGYSVIFDEISINDKKKKCFLVKFKPAFKPRPSFVVTVSRPLVGLPQDNAIFTCQDDGSEFCVFTGFGEVTKYYSFSFIAIGQLK